MSNKTKKLLILNLPYFIAGLVCTNLGEAWRIAEGADMSEKLLGFLSALGAAFSNPMPSLHPMDLLIGVCCGAGLRLAVYLKGKNAKKYRHGMEYGSARTILFCDPDQTVRPLPVKKTRYHSAVRSSHRHRDRQRAFQPETVFLPKADRRQAPYFAQTAL